jgi:hypothetical protein
MRDKTAWRTAGLLPLFLVGCTTSDPGMGITPPGAISGASADSSPAVVADLSPAPMQPGPTGARPPAGASQNGPIQFLPLVGAPAEKVALLSRALAGAAAANGIVLSPADGPVAPQRLKGYLSVLPEGRATVVIYVWDVVDPQGVRLNRLQGQQRIEAVNAADPWSVVDASAMATIAATTMDEFRRSAPRQG